jgi:hypothetical protein
MLVESIRAGSARQVAGKLSRASSFISAVVPTPKRIDSAYIPLTMWAKGPGRFPRDAV